MKKSILVLLVLLAVLIVICVYQKTYTIYSTSPKEITLIERESNAQNTNTEKSVSVEKKEEKPSTLPVVSVPTPAKPVEVTPVIKAKPVPNNKPVVKTDETVKKETKVKASSSTKNSISVLTVPATETKKESITAPSTTKIPKVESTDKIKPVIQNSGEKEIVEYIMWALKNRDIALKNRDEVEAHIQELITTALSERNIVLEERSKNEVALEKLQTELIDARDASYESVINPKTTNQGEK